MGDFPKRPNSGTLTFPPCWSLQEDSWLHKESVFYSSCLKTLPRCYKGNSRFLIGTRPCTIIIARAKFTAIH